MTSASAPITQDLVTLPRKLPEGPINLVGLTRDALQEALITAGTPDEAGENAAGAALAMDLRKRRARF